MNWRCPLCGEEEKIYRHISDDVQIRRDKINLIECWHCGHIGLLGQFQEAHQQAIIQESFESPYESAMKFYKLNFKS